MNILNIYFVAIILGAAGVFAYDVNNKQRRRNVLRAAESNIERELVSCGRGMVLVPFQVETSVPELEYLVLLRVTDYLQGLADRNEQLRDSGEIVTKAPDGDTFEVGIEREEFITASGLTKRSRYTGKALVDLKGGAKYFGDARGMDIIDESLDSKVITGTTFAIDYEECGKDLLDGSSSSSSPNNESTDNDDSSGLVPPLAARGDICYSDGSDLCCNEWEPCVAFGGVDPATGQPLENLDCPSCPENCAEFNTCDRRCIDTCTTDEFLSHHIAAVVGVGGALAILGCLYGFFCCKRKQRD